MVKKRGEKRRGEEREEEEEEEEALTEDPSLLMLLEMNSTPFWSDSTEPSPSDGNTTFSNKQVRFDSMFSTQQKGEKLRNLSIGHHVLSQVLFWRKKI